MLDSLGTPAATNFKVDGSLRKLQGTLPFMAPEGKLIRELAHSAPRHPHIHSHPALGLALLRRTVLRQVGHGRKADIWSVGCVVVEMATGGGDMWTEFSNQVRTSPRASDKPSRVLFRSQREWPVHLRLRLRLRLHRQLSALYHIASTGKHPPIPDQLSDECKRFLARCFVKNPAERASAAELLTDAWLTTHL